MSCICLEPNCNKKAATGQIRCKYHLRCWLQHGAKLCAQHPTCPGVLMPGVKVCPICRSAPFKMAGCERCTDFYRHDPDRAGECTSCGHQHGSRGSSLPSRTPSGGVGGDPGGYGPGDDPEYDLELVAVQRSTLKHRSSKRVSMCSLKPSRVLGMSFPGT